MTRKEYQIRYWKEHKDKKKINNRNYYLRNKDKILKRNKEWILHNKKKANQRIFKYQKNKYRNNSEFRLYNCLRSRLRLALKGNPKLSTTMNLVGCSIIFLKKHLESQFKQDMNWANYGLHGWHIDHIKPCAKFDLSKPEEQKKCFHYTNLQPLWAAENIIKSDIYKEEL